MTAQPNPSGAAKPADPRAAIIKAVQADLATQRQQISAAQEVTRQVILQAQQQALEQSKHYASLAQTQLQQSTQAPGQPPAGAPAKSPSTQQDSSLLHGSLTAAQSLKASQELSTKAMEFSKQQIDNIMQLLRNPSS